MDITHKITVTAIELYKVSFEAREKLEPSISRELEFNLEVGLHRSAEDELQYALMLKSDNKYFLAQVGYRTIFRSSPGLETEAERVKEFEHIARVIAPTTLFPFLRQTLMQLTQQAGYNRFVLPLLDLAALFDKASLPIPELDPEAQKKKSPVKSAPSRRKRVIKTI
jgi:preprotein translocase subunit SecB